MNSINWPELLIGTAIAWALGLLPALIARYLWAKAPLRKSTANWIAGITCASFWLIFRILNAIAAEAAGQTETSPPDRGFVWLLIFFVATWIMTRGDTNAEADREDLSVPLQESPALETPRQSTVDVGQSHEGGFLKWIAVAANVALIAFTLIELSDDDFWSLPLNEKLLVSLFFGAPLISIAALLMRQPAPSSYIALVLRRKRLEEEARIAALAGNQRPRED